MFSIFVLINTVLFHNKIRHPKIELFLGNTQILGKKRPDISKCSLTTAVYLNYNYSFLLYKPPGCVLRVAGTSFLSAKVTHNEIEQKLKVPFMYLFNPIIQSMVQVVITISTLNMRAKVSTLYSSDIPASDVQRTKTLTVQQLFTYGHN